MFASTTIGTTDHLVDQIIQWTYVDCPTYAKEHADHKDCPHKSQLAAILPVSRLWFDVAAKHLWNTFATWHDFRKLVCGPTGTNLQVRCTSALTRGFIA